MPDVRIGISGWRYAGWRGGFYPKGLRQADELAYASSRLTSIEINGSFYSLQRPERYTAWAATVPPGFVFSVKGPRFVTHLKRLRDVATPVANFFASGVLALGPALGPVLWQTPPQLAYDRDVLAAFLDLLPATTGQAATLARGHDSRLDGRAHLVTDADRPLRHALEVRHASFAEAAVLAELRPLLAARNVALVLADAARDWPVLDEATADFGYARLHGHDELYTSGYDEADLQRWAGVVRAWNAAGRDAFVYFDNDAKVRAPFDAMRLAEILGVAAPTAAFPPA